jgi:hypothetical protein
LTSTAFRLLLSRLTGMSREFGTLVAMTREVLDRILPIPAASPSATDSACAARLKAGSFLLERDPRSEGESAYSEWKRLRLACRGLHTAWQLHRL